MSAEYIELEGELSRKSVAKNIQLDCDEPHCVIPERNLVAAVLWRAIRDLAISDYRRKALWWMLDAANKDSDCGYTFEQCCAYLNLDPTHLRKKVRKFGLYCEQRLREEQIQEIPRLTVVPSECIKFLEI